MVMKHLPIPRQEWTHVTLNPRARTVSKFIIPAQYVVDNDGLDWFCPHCHQQVTSAITIAVLWVKHGEYRQSVKVCQCSTCGEHLFTISLFDLMKHFEARRNYNG